MDLGDLVDRWWIDGLFRYLVFTFKLYDFTIRIVWYIVHKPPTIYWSLVISYTVSYVYILNIRIYEKQSLERTSKDITIIT